MQSKAANRWYKKALSSFQQERSYQGLREFNSALIRAIEDNQLEITKAYFIEFSLVLEKLKLIHEAGQIVELFIKYLRKHKKIDTGINTLLDSIATLLERKSALHVSIAYYETLINSFAGQNDYKTMVYILDESKIFLSFLQESDMLLQFVQHYYSGLIYIRNWEKALPLGQKYFFEATNSENLINYSVYTILLLALSGNPDQALTTLKNLKKKLSDQQNESLPLEGAGEFLLAIRSNDLDWWIETKNHFTEKGLFHDRIMTILVTELFNQNFPDAPKSSILDFFL